jgi:magnesium chelatase family protein
MSLAIVYTRARCGVDAPLVSVETHLSNGLPAFNIVGLPETAVKESKDRVRSAIINSHFEFPSQRITVNLAPADLPKQGGRYDLPIALGILAASGQVPTDKLNNLEFIGELALTGELRAVVGSLPAAIQSQRAKRSIVVPTNNADETALCEQATILPCQSLLQLCAHLHGRELISPHQKSPQKKVATLYPDFNEVKGQHYAKRALEIAAAGNHNVIFSGPPGTGKTMLASRLPGILPALNSEEILEVATIFSIAHQHKSITENLQRPFRSPHHTASAVAMVGGGSHPRPGEISLAHCGILFLDELPEFPRKVLEVLREPLESGEINISRAQQQVLFPAKFQLIAAMNPCPCGFFGDSEQACCCSPDKIRRYRDKISGPLLDRIDLQVNVARLPASQLINVNNNAESSATIRSRVESARSIQRQRSKKLNAELEGREIDAVCVLSEGNQQLLAQAIQHYKFSPRAYHRILKVSRTIADLDNQKEISAKHLSEAINYRALDKRF